MPIRPTPIHYSCPACGHAALDAKAAGALQGEVAQVLGAIEPLWKSRR